MVKQRAAEVKSGKYVGQYTPDAAAAAAAVDFHRGQQFHLRVDLLVSGRRGCRA